jgi:2-phospho-L-lactate guanylyltransferase
VTIPAIIPLNRLDRAKARLQELLTPAERRELTLINLRQVVAAARDAGLDPLVLTPDAAEVGALLGPGTAVLAEDPGRKGLNEQLEGAVAGRDLAVIVHADLPLATGSDLRRVVEVALASPGPSATLVESSDGGTNVMVLRPAGRFALAYGPGSHAEHARRARAAGMLTASVVNPALALDLDTPADIAAFLDRDDGRDSPAGRYLVARGVRERLAAAR